VLSLDRSGRASAALAEVTGLPVVSMSIDGCPVLGAFEVDSAEDERRSTLDVGAVTSLSLLYGLWQIPVGGRVQAASLPEKKRAELLSSPDLVRACGGGLERTYAPPGILRAAGFLGRDPSRAVRRAARFTPIVERFVAVEAGDPLATSTLREAREWGVGVVRAEDAQFVVPTLSAVLGVPSVYRWWIAELAYLAVIQARAHPVS
jgi:hypothetical protein